MTDTAASVDPATAEEPEPILTFQKWRDNADLIARGLVPLGWLKPDMRVLDPTYGMGRFWTAWRPADLTACDLNPERSPIGYSVDFTAMPFAEEFDAVVFDPPYKLNGTPDSGGPANSDEDYGVEKATRWQDRMALCQDGIAECVRVLKPRSPGGFIPTLIIKCQDQVVSGDKRFQTIEFSNAAVRQGLTLVDMLHLPSYRPQPKGRGQKRSRSNYSTFLVLQRR